MGEENDRLLEDQNEEYNSDPGRERQKVMPLKLRFDSAAPEAIEEVEKCLSLTLTLITRSCFSPPAAWHMGRISGRFVFACLGGTEIIEKRSENW